tara:strand:+ start:3231 stop:6314 length:3084 start_codon:yes stop_codon:yes gene_type:complete
MADNPTRKFKFISPGVFVDEIDNSQLPATPASVGPLVIGRARKGPAMEPVTVDSFSEFVDLFGAPQPGNETGDISRYGNTMGPTYGPYAAQAWLRNSSPITFMRTVGVEDPNKTSGGEAGWKAGTLDDTPANGGAFGLFLWPSGVLNQSNAADNNQGAVVTGALAAVFYCTGGRVMLSGTRADAEITASVSELYKTNTNGDIDLLITKDGTFASRERVTVSLNKDKNNFIRKVLNTNPTVTNTAITRRSTATASQGGAFWLGETYEQSLFPRSQATIGELVASSTLGNAAVTTATAWAAILPLRNQETVSEDHNDFQFGAQKSTTGFYFCQALSHPTDTTTTSSYDALAQQKLFRFESLTPGDWVQNTVKISIEKIKAPRGDFEKYGTFSVVVRDLMDSDNKPIILERYDNCDLDPASPNYLAKKIGDKFVEYDTTEKRNRMYGQYPNRSKFIRVEMDDDVDAGVTDPQMLPFGVFGPLTYRSVSIISGSGGLVSVSGTGNGVIGTNGLSASRGAVASMVDGGQAARFGTIGGFSGAVGTDATPGILGGLGGQQGLTASCVFPSVPLRKQDSWGSPKNLEYTYWGAWTGNNSRDVKFNQSILDMLKPRVNGLQSNPASTDHDLKESPNQDRASQDPLVISWHFSLDELSGTAAEGFEYVSGAIKQTNTAMSFTRLNASYSSALNAGLDRFTTVLHGGFEGFDVTEKDPFRNTAFSTATDEKASYQLHTLRRAINIVSDPEDAQYNVITLPGIIQNNVTEHLLDTVEERADALAIIDVDNIYTPSTENTESVSARNAATVTQAVDALKDRNLNNSYGAAYAPWLRIRDSISQRTLWVPPSVAALGVLSTTDNRQGPWFAPAGFTRGGLTEGAAGIPVLDVSRKYTQDQRDDLYEANINPIAKFPAEGIVIFGQKTLQQTRSALDRINVRRLMIYLKREISFIASRLLFDPNVQTTWNKFKADATSVLDDVKARFGIEEFRLVLDETTTTPDLVDQNIIYAKLLVKPTRAVEFFAIDFVVTNSGASFED